MFEQYRLDDYVEIYEVHEDGRWVPGRVRDKVLDRERNEVVALDVWFNESCSYLVTEEDRVRPLQLLGGERRQYESPPLTEAVMTAALRQVADEAMNPPEPPEPKTFTGMETRLPNWPPRRERVIYEQARTAHGPMDVPVERVVEEQRIRVTPEGFSISEWVPVGRDQLMAERFDSRLYPQHRRAQKPVPELSPENTEAVRECVRKLLKPTVDMMKNFAIAFDCLVETKNHGKLNVEWKLTEMKDVMAMSMIEDDPADQPDYGTIKAWPVNSDWKVTSMPTELLDTNNPINYPVHATAKPVVVREGDTVEVLIHDKIGWAVGKVLSVHPLTVTVRLEKPIGLGGMNHNAYTVLRDGHVIRHVVPAQARRCDCGAAKARTSHAHWCSAYQP